MKTFLRMAILPLLLLTLASVAFADPYTFQLGSYRSKGVDGVIPNQWANMNKALFYVGYNPISEGLGASFMPPANVLLTTTYSIQGNPAWAGP